MAEPMLQSAIDELRDPGHLNLLTHDELEDMILALIDHIDYCSAVLNSPEVDAQASQTNRS